jgi:hypothetical protein
LKFPQNIIIDFSNYSINYSSKYWINKYLFNFKKTDIDFNCFTFQQKFTNNSNYFLNYFKKSNLSNLSLIYSNNTNNSLIKKNLKIQIMNFFKLKYKNKHPLIYANHWSQEIYFYNTVKNQFSQNIWIRGWNNFSKKNLRKKNINNNLWNYFDINFIKKEKIYTKLKYSRVPQYDIVSGGVAAIFAGFLGFLICEKFGFELLDSGDFYFLFMYGVFFFFVIKLFLKISNNKIDDWNFFSFKWFLMFYKFFFFFFLKKLIKK